MQCQLGLYSVRRVFFVGFSYVDFLFTIWAIIITDYVPPLYLLKVADMTSH